MPGPKVYQREDGRYCGAVQVNGQRRFYYGRTAAEVRAKLKEASKAAMTTGSLPTPGTRTLNDLLDAWLDVAELRPKTQAGYEATLKLIRPALGDVRLSRLEPIHLQSLYAELGKTSKRNAYRAHLLLHHALKLAVLWGWLATSPAERVIKPTYRPARKAIWTPAEVGAFLNGTVGHWLHPLFVVAVYSGLRLGELIGLRWPDVDLPAATLKVEGSLQYVQGQWVRGEPKTAAGRREVALPPAAVAALREQKGLQAATRLRAGAKRAENNLVFTGRWGGPLWQNTVEKAMQDWCGRLGLPKLTPHGLRHLHASLLLAEGVPITDVSQRLGHSNVAITGAVYAHALPGQDQQAAEALSRALGGVAMG